MTYNLPPGVTYTQMAMYFDKHIKDVDRNDSLLYQYLYHLVYMLTSKAKYFQKYEDMDQFALYAATKIYLRAINQAPMVSVVDEAIDTTIKSVVAAPIKSILNYVKAVLYPMKVDFQKEAYEEIINPEKDDRINGDRLRDNLNGAIQSDYQDGLMEEMYCQLEQLPRYIKEVVEESPYKHDIVICRRIYMSVLITFLKSITFSNPGMDKIKRREERDLSTEDTKFKMLDRERLTSTTVWRLKDSMINYIELLTNKVRKKFGQDLIQVRRSFLLKEHELDAIVKSAYVTDQRDNNEEF